MTTLTLTPNVDQTKAEEKLLDFLFSSEREMRLIGPGGTGKSWLVKRFITQTLEAYKQNCRLIGIEPEYNSYVLTAMTNKAAQALQDATGIEVSTTHSYLNLTIRPNHITGLQDLTRTANWSIKEWVIIFIDEAYMMDSKLLEELRMSTMNCKIVFIGDDKQLDPIDESQSPIDRLDCMTAELTIPVRNAGSMALQELCAQLRETVAAAVRGDADAFKPIKLVPGEIDYVDDIGMEAALNGPLLTPSNDHRILAFSNSKVNDYNNYLRIARGQSILFERGEILISNDLYERGKFRIRNEQTVEIIEADPKTSFIQNGDLNVPVQLVRISADPLQQIPVIIDREFHKEAIKFVQKRAKSKHENWERYFWLKQSFGDFRPRDACTVHKSQGSTHDTVYIDLANIGSCNFTVMVARMLYVAVSRARLRVVFYGNLPSKYGGLIL